MAVFTEKNYGEKEIRKKGDAAWQQAFDEVVNNEILARINKLKRKAGRQEESWRQQSFRMCEI